MRPIYIENFISVPKQVVLVVSVVFIVELYL